MTEELICVTFSDNKLIPPLFGEQDIHLTRLEEALNVSTSSRGNILSIAGKAKDVSQAKVALERLYHDLEQGHSIGLKEVDAAIRLASPREDKREGLFPMQDLMLSTRKKTITPYSHNQSDYLELLQKKDLVFAVGPAGTGKTYLAVATAVSMLINHKVERIILSRPAVEAGEKLGYLPGDLKEKIDPYLRPLYDALHDMLPGELVAKYIQNGDIEIAPLAFMRGRTLNDSFIILDEAQNTTPTQMKMFLTRLGQRSRIVVTGDISQVDLPKDAKSGLQDALEKLRNIPEIGFASLTDKDIIRHPLTAKIVQAYGLKPAKSMKQPKEKENSST